VNIYLEGDKDATICFVGKRQKIYLVRTEDWLKAESSVLDAGILGELFTKLVNDNKLNKISIIIEGIGLNSTFNRIDFSNLTRLKELTISNYSGEETIIPTSIYHLNRLRNLEISMSNLNSLSRDIEHLRSLEILDLHNNGLNYLPAEIANLKNLRYLNLNRDQFKEVPSCVSKLKNLKYLNMGKNEVELLPIDLDNLNKVECLNLSGLRLRTFLQDYNFPYLDTLILSNTLTDSIPDNIAYYKDLKVLDLEYANIVYVSNKINDLQNLNTLNLGHSYVSKQEVEKAILSEINIIHSETTCYDIDFAKHYPSHIRSLRLSYKELEKLNDNLFEFNELKNITITNMRRGQLDTNFIKTPDLNKVCRRLSQMEKLETFRYEYFDYYENSMPDLSGIEQLKNIKALQLTMMRMTEFPVIVCKLINLETLALGFNKIANIPDEISQLVNLKRLDLRKNCIHEIPSSIYNLKNLEFLDMVNNNITEVPSDLSKMPMLKKVYLYNIRNRDGYDNSCYNEIMNLTPEVMNLVKTKVIVID